ncbi:MAG: cysteine desulfurase [Prevotellaceae bacterium]|nr:cysteine desulfurase [Prevotellaceae bacterium]
MYDIDKIRADFPILSRQVYGKPLVYLDNAATTQKPACVINAIAEEYCSVNANVHRGVHYLSQQATDLHESARETIRKFINAKKSCEIVFTRGTTESINLVASSMSRWLNNLSAGVFVSTMEHHSNIVPWQLNGFRTVPVSGFPPHFEDLDWEGICLVSITHVSNVLGEINPIKKIIRIAHEHGVPVLIDGAQSTPHLKIDVQDLDCDFFVFSGHKIYGPTGIGVLYGKEEWLEKLPPYQGGGEMIDKVTFEKTTFERLPYKFEAGTPDYIATHGLAKALDYVLELGIDNIAAHESELVAYAVEQLSAINGMKIYGQPQASVVSFNLRDIHHLDVGTLSDRLGIAVRTGHHCAQPLMEQLGVSGTVRASFALYNTKNEIDALASALQRINRMF